MTRASAFLLACGLAAVALIAVGVAFLAVPDRALALADHELQALPQVMGGRYLSYGLILAAVAWRRDWSLLAGVLAIFGIVGFVDAGIYWHSNPVPHLTAGVLAFGAAGVAFILGRHAPF